MPEDPTKTALQASQAAVEGTATPLPVEHKNAANKPPGEREEIYPTTKREAKKARNAKSNARNNPTNNPRRDHTKRQERRNQVTSNGKRVGARADNRPASVTTILAPAELALPKWVTQGKATDPEEWKWDKIKLAVAEGLAEGHTIKDVSMANDVGRTTIYEWLNHPSGEMRRYMDALITETSIANKRLRIARLVRLGDRLFDVAEAKFDQLLDPESGTHRISEEGLKGIVSELREVAMLVAKERQQLIDIVKTDNTNTNVNIDGNKIVEEYLGGLSEDERLQREQEFKALGDQFIAKYTGK